MCIFLRSAQGVTFTVSIPGDLIVCWHVFECDENVSGLLFLDALPQLLSQANVAHSFVIFFASSFKFDSVNVCQSVHLIVYANRIYIYICDNFQVGRNRLDISPRTNAVGLSLLCSKFFQLNLSEQCLLLLGQAICRNCAHRIMWFGDQSNCCLFFRLRSYLNSSNLLFVPNTSTS